jgi:hypothetical protein
MIQPLRTVHRRAFVALAVVLPAIVLIGLGARHARSGPTARPIDVPVGAYVVRTSTTLWQKHSMQSRFYGKPDHPQDIYLVLQPMQELNEPDLLIYWVTDAPRGNVLPANARLVGAFAMGKAFLLPLEEKRAGHLVLFSPARQTVFDTARVEKLP